MRAKGGERVLMYLSAIESSSDKAKFTAIYESYRDLMFYVANDILHDTWTAEDVVHQAFLRLLPLLPRIDQPTCPRTRALVVTITRHAAIDVYRRRQNHPTLPLEEGLTLPPRRDELANLPQAEAVARAISALPLRYREVLLLKYDAGYTEAEIAGALSLTAANVHKTVQRAKQKLETLLEAEGGAEP